MALDCWYEFRRQDAAGELYRPLAQRVSLDCLRRVPAYREFEGDLAEALAAQGFIQP